MEHKFEDIVLRNPGTPCSLHINPELEIVHVRSGVLQVLYGRSKVNLNAGQTLLILPYHMHAFTPLSHVEATVYMFFEKIYGNILERYPCTSCSVAEVPAAAAAYLRDLDNNRLRLCQEFYARSVFDLFFNLFLTQTGNIKSRAACEDDDYRIIEYIFKHLDDNLNIEKLASLIGTDAKKLSIRFNEKYGIRLKELIRNIRINRAILMLETQQKTITEIALESGFSSLRSFNRVFLEQIGVSPTEYRKRHKNS